MSEAVDDYEARREAWKAEETAEWEMFEALWWSEMKVRGQLQAYCDVACDDLNELEVAVDELVKARLKAEAALAKANRSTDGAEAFAKLVGQVLASPAALIDAGNRLDGLRRRRR